MGMNAYDLIRNHFPYALGRVAISYALCGAAMAWALIAARSWARDGTEQA
jgi:hypothetical protein